MNRAQMLAHGRDVEIEQERLAFRVLPEEGGEDFAVDYEDLAVGESNRIAGAALLVDRAQQPEEVARVLDAVG